MTTYLELDNPRVEGIMNGIIEEIVYHFQPQAVIISGGFGRNEPSFIEDVKRIKFLSDCEIVIVSYKYVPQKKLDGLAKKLTQRTGLEVVLHNSLRLCVYSKSNLPSAVSKRIWRSSIANYDLKYGSRVAFGEDALQYIPDIKSEDIPIWEGIRLMFNRMAASLEYFPIIKQKREETIYWINKVIIACQDALVLSEKQYHHSYATRNAILSELLPQYLNELNEKSPKLLPLAVKATNYKLAPGKNTYPEDLTGLWFDVAEVCNQVFKHVIKRDMDITFNSYIEFRDKYLKHSKIKGKYYLGIISLPLFHNATNTIRMIKTGSYRFPSYELIKNPGIPWKHIIYSLIPMVYFGVSRHGRINEPVLEQVRKTISLFKRLAPNKKNRFEEWQYLKEQVSELWHTLCY